MMIPKGPNGFPTVSPTMLRRYGSAGFRLDEGEATKGCPRLFRKQYVERVVPFSRSFELDYGSMLHEALQHMEVEGDGPDEALAAVFPKYPSLAPEAYEEALDDLHRYIERGATPRDLYGTIDTERELTALLYEDEEYGPIYIRAILDWLGVDLEQPNVLHTVDYKTNRGRSSVDDVRGDVQMRFQDLVTALCWSEFMNTSRPEIVVHLDEIKFDNGDIAVRYSASERDAFRSWLIAVVRHILRDDKGNPKLNPGCAYCPVKSSCGAYQKLPDVAKQVVDLRPDGEETTPDEVMSWRDQAWRMKTLLEKACKEIDADFLDKAKAAGGMVLSEYVYEQKTEWENRVDVRTLHARLGDRFYDVVTASKTALERLTKDWPASERDMIMQTIERVPSGSKMTKAKKKRA